MKPSKCRYTQTRVEITWENKDGLTKTKAKCGMNLMRVAHKHGIDLEGAWRRC